MGPLHAKQMLLHWALPPLFMDVRCGLRTWFSYLAKAKQVIHRLCWWETTYYLHATNVDRWEITTYLFYHTCLCKLEALRPLPKSIMLFDPPAFFQIDNPCTIYTDFFKIPLGKVWWQWGELVTNMSIRQMSMRLQWAQKGKLGCSLIRQEYPPRNYTKDKVG